MTVDWLLWTALAGLAVTTLAAIGVNVLHEFSLHELELYCRRRNRRERYTQILDQHERAVVSAECLQVVGMVVTLAAGTIGYFAREWRLTELPAAGDFAIVLLVASVALIIATAWVPLAVVRLWAAPFLFHTWWLWRLISWVCAPLSLSLDLVDAVVWRLAGREEEEEDEEEAFEDEIRAMVNEGLRDGLLEEDAREMIEGVIELGDVEVGQIMTPRSEIDALEVETAWPQLLAFVAEAGRTRIPVFRESLDNIVGILYVKDLLAEFATKPEHERRPLSELLRDPWHVPVSKAVDVLLQEFLHTRNHMAIVVDEYHATTGVVTIEDALEEIVGEIVDESDEEEADDVLMIDDATFEATGRAHLADLNEEFGLGLPESDEYDTISGLVIARLGYIPPVDESLTWHNLRLVVLEATPRRIERVRIEVLDEVQPESA